MTNFGIVTCDSQSTHLLIFMFSKKWPMI